MTTTKIIANIIYWLGLPVLAISDFSHFPFYFVLAGILIQTLFILSVYKMNNRNISGEAMLVRKHDAFTFKDFFLFILVVLLLSSIQLFFLKALPRLYIVIYFSVGLVSLIIQYLIESGKTTPVFIIESNNLFVNDLFITTYNLNELAGIGFNGFDEIYIVRFAKNKRIKIKQEDYPQEALDHFFAVMLSKSRLDVEVSENIRNEIMAAANRPALPG